MSKTETTKCNIEFCLSAKIPDSPGTVALKFNLNNTPDHWTAIIDTGTLINREYSSPTLNGLIRQTRHYFGVHEMIAPLVNDKKTAAFVKFSRNFH